MLFVPLPLFATIFLLMLCCRFVLTRDMTLRAHQLFAGLVVLYAVQSLLVSLCWGYEMSGLAPYLIILAPVLEALFKQDGLYKDEDLSLRRLARKLGLPDRQVSHAINRVRGMSVSQFVNDFRIREACALLKSSDKSVLEISLIAGFATLSNFNREFMRVTAQTPSSWRTENTLDAP